MLLYKKGENPCEFSPCCMRSLVACAQDDIFLLAQCASDINCDSPTLLGILVFLEHQPPRLSPIPRKPSSCV